jgi:hypothetical protein
MRYLIFCLVAIWSTVWSASLAAQDPVRTADFTLRGLTAADFPRVKKLADNVYSFEQIDPTKRTVTVNNLIVITTGGVLIAESQGTVENVKRLVAEVAKLTPQPIKSSSSARSMATTLAGSWRSPPASSSSPIRFPRRESNSRPNRSPTSG